MELIQQRTLNYMRFCFMVAGHTKVAPDRLFAQVSNSYNRHDVFTVGELKDICILHAQTTIEEGVSVLQWREVFALNILIYLGLENTMIFLLPAHTTSLW